MLVPFNMIAAIPFLYLKSMIKQGQLRELVSSQVFISSNIHFQEVVWYKQFMAQFNYLPILFRNNSV